MSYDESNSLAGFIARLNLAMNQAGHPSLTELETTAHQLARDNRGGDLRLEPLYRTTTQAILAGNRLGVPRWPWVLSFVTVLHAIARRNGIPPEDVGAIAEWRQWHQAVAAAAPPGPLPAWDRQDNWTADQADHHTALAVITRPGHGFDQDELLSEFVQLIKRGGARQGWDGYGDVVRSDLRVYMTLESYATRVRMYAPGLVPVLLQTEAYAHAVVSQWKPKANAAEIARYVELRPLRQRQLTEPDAFQLWAMVEEQALRPGLASRAVMRRQVRHLIEMVDHPKVAIGVFRSAPADADVDDDNLTIKEPVSVFRFEQPYFGDVVSIEDLDTDGIMFIHERQNAAHYNHLLDGLAIRTSETSREVQDRLRSLLRDL